MNYSSVFAPHTIRGQLRRQTVVPVFADELLRLKEMEQVARSNPASLQCHLPPCVFATGQPWGFRNIVCLSRAGGSANPHLGTPGNQGAVLGALNLCWENPEHRSW